jgi:hypothetical protein
VEEFVEDAKTSLGLAPDETRSDLGWHLHLSLVEVPHLFVTLTHAALKKKVPELTFDRTVRLLRWAFEAGSLSLSRAILLVDYHIRRNAIARASHEKTWRLKHKKVEFLLL